MLNFYENQERTLTKGFFDQKGFTLYNFTEPGSKRGWDGTYKLFERDTSTFFEVKTRNFPVSKYPDYILEARKALSLSNWHNKGFTTNYFNFFINSDGTYDLIIFNIQCRINLWRQQGEEKVIVWRWLPEFTYKKSNKIQKAIILIKYDPLIDLKYEKLQLK